MEVKRGKWRFQLTASIGEERCSMDAFTGIIIHFDLQCLVPCVQLKYLL